MRKAIALTASSACFRLVMLAKVPTIPSNSPWLFNMGVALTLIHETIPSGRQTPITMSFTGCFSVMARGPAISAGGISDPSTLRMAQSGEV